ncbi:hypothetical protein [Streptomyces sp. PA5.6]|uniref:hypothetical protein n=1 Tax=Streptomyces sp. PA5.6 TaxID=3035651 RepID=UPI0039049BA7
MLHKRAAPKLPITNKAAHERVPTSISAEDQDIRSSSAIRADRLSPAAPRSTVWAYVGPHAATVSLPPHGLRKQLVHRLAGAFSTAVGCADLSTGNLMQGPGMDQELMYAQGTL